MINYLFAFLVLLFFAIDDYKTNHSKVEHILIFFILAIVFNLVFNNLFLASIVCFLVLLFLYLFQKMKITYLGDTLVGGLIGFISGDFIFVMVSFVIGFVFVHLFKNYFSKRVAFLPFVFIGCCLYFLANLFI